VVCCCVPGDDSENPPSSGCVLAEGAPARDPHQAVVSSEKSRPVKLEAARIEKAVGVRRP
jgi:hypothetical protein